jgi:hypothetical protein
MSAKKYPRSFFDCRGMLCISCAECERGFNGSAEDKCAAGGTRSRANGMGYCTLGKLMASIDWSAIRSLPSIVRHMTGDKSHCFNGTHCRGIDKCAGWDTCQKKGRS